MLRKGVDVVTVANYLGNSPDVVYRHYSHVLNRGKKEAAVLMNGLIVGNDDV